MPVFELNRKAKRLLDGALKHAGSAALAAALVPLGSLTVSAGTIVDPGYSSRVDSMVSGSADPFLYEFRVFNTSGFSLSLEGIPVIVDWELPLFAATDVSNVQSPDGWRHELIQPFDANPSVWDYNAAMDPLLMGDPGLYGPNPEVFEEPPLVLHWFLEGEGEGGGPIEPGESLGGFSFESPYSQQNAPYLTSWIELPPVGGDPPIPNQSFGTPLSPQRQAAQTPPTGAVPEPTSLVIFGMGTLLVGVGLVRRKRKLDSMAFSINTDSVES